MNKVRIVEVCAVDGTMDNLLRELNLSLIDNGYDVIGVCSHGNVTQKLVNDGFNIISVDIDRSIKPLSNLKSVIRMYRLFRRLRPDIVHVHTPVAAALGRIAAKMAGVPVIVYTAHGFYFHENMKPVVYRLALSIEKFLARHFTDFIFTQSAEDAGTAVVNKFMQQDKVLAIGNGVDIWEKFNPEKINNDEVYLLKKEFGVGERDRVITFVGRLVKEKGIFDLLKAFIELERDNVKLLVVGNVFQGDRDKETCELVQEYKKFGNIIFTGARNDINNILYFTDIFCLPSYREGMPRSIIEAMAMRCAIVATNIRGSREEVVEGRTGFLTKLSDTGDLRDRIVKLLDDNILLEGMKLNGRRRAEELYDEKKVVKLQLDIFEKLLN